MARNSKRFQILVLFGALVFGVGSAHAQFDAQTFRPDPGGLGSLGVSSSRTVRPGLLVLGVFGNYAVDPVSADLPGGSLEVTTDLTTIDLLATIGLAEGWEAGLDLPVSFIRNVAFADDLDSFTAGLGDIALFTKWAPVSRDRGPFGFALDLRLTLPTGDEGNFLGAEGVTVDGGVLLDGKIGPVGAAARVGYLFRSEDEGLGDALTFETALVYEGHDNAFRPLVELHGSSVLDDFGTEEGSPLEAIVGFRWELPLAGLASLGGPTRGLVLSSGIGFGLNDGIGSPSVRGIVGLSALTGGSASRAESRASRMAVRPTRAAPDTDRDGIPDAYDVCPRRAENFDGHLDLDGCPDVGGPARASQPVFRAERVPPSPAVVAPPGQRPPALAPPVGSPRSFRPVRFASNGQGVSTASGRELDRLRDVLLSDPTLRVQLIGHADASGDPEQNVMLSVDRAVRVEAALVRRGIDRRRIMALGVGDVEPVATNATPQGRSLNRRVEIQLLPATF